MRKKGCEYGATTGRPRRCGWLDMPALKYAIMINGVTKLLMTKADILSGFKTISICTSYLTGGLEHVEILSDNSKTIEPVYTDIEGWDEDISAIKEYKSLPRPLKYFIEFVETQTGVLVSMVSVGPDRNATIFK